MGTSASVHAIVAAFCVGFWTGSVLLGLATYGALVALAPFESRR